MQEQFPVWSIGSEISRRGAALKAGALAQERDIEIDLLKRQLEEFVVKQRAYAAGGAVEEGGVAVAERPAGADWDIPSAWRTAEATKPRCLALIHDG